MKKGIYIISIFILITVVAGIHLNSKLMSIATYHSPDGHYELIIKNSHGFFTWTMPGNGGNIEVEVILKDAMGIIIGTSHNHSNCGIFKDSIEITWDLKNEQVWYARGKAMHLKTGEVTC